MVNEQASNFSGYVSSGANSGQNVNCKSFVVSGSIEVGNLAYCEGNLSCAGELYLRDGYQSEKVAGSGSTNNSSNYRLLNMHNATNTSGSAGVDVGAGVVLLTVANLALGFIHGAAGAGRVYTGPSDALLRAFAKPNGELLGDGDTISFTIQNTAANNQPTRTITLNAGAGGSHRGATGGGTVASPVISGGGAGRFMIHMTAGGGGHTYHRFSGSTA